MIIIRSIEKKDMNTYFEMQKELDQETKFMMYEPGERQMSEDRFLRKVDELATSGSCLLVALDGDKVVGVMGANRGEMRRIKHCAYIFTGILSEYRHQGIGKRFFIEIESWAKSIGVTRLELSVMCHNENAIKLYQNSGFEIEGKKLRAMKVDGEYVDEYYMAKLL
jgi:RimJ/RimL family protein N-acetyltransferase